MSATPFISRDDLSDFIGQDVTTSDKALIAVDSACDIVRTEAEQTFNEIANETIVLDGTGTDALLLPERPVISVGAVVENGTTLAANTDYKLNGNGILLRVWGTSVGWNWVDYGDWPRYPRRWMKGRQNISVTYSHGYPANDFPRDVRMVALALAARIFGQQSGVAFESLGQYSVRYDGSADDLSKSEKAILRKHKQSK